MFCRTFGGTYHDPCDGENEIAHIRIVVAKNKHGHSLNAMQKLLKGYGKDAYSL